MIISGRSSRCRCSSAPGAIPRERGSITLPATWPLPADLLHLGTMKRNLLALTIVAAAACFDVSSPIPPTLILSPILDSLFVGDSLVPRDFAYYNSDGERANPGPLSWSIGPTSVATINATTGVIHGVGKGVATVIASGGQAAGIALVAVSRPLDLTLLMDTVVLMQQDTFTIPVAVLKKDVSATDTVWFDPSPSPRVDTINTSSGLVGAVTASGTR